MRVKGKRHKYEDCVHQNVLFIILLPICFLCFLRFSFHLIFLKDGFVQCLQMVHQYSCMFLQLNDRRVEQNLQF